MLFNNEDIYHRLLSYDISVLQLFFGGMTTGVFIVSVLINVAEKHLPSHLVTTFRYGKLSKENGREIFKTLPKSWFKHFYLIGVIWCSIITTLLFSVYVCGSQPQKWFVTLLNYVASRKRIASGTAAAALLGILLLLIHCIVRLYEVFFISVYSPSRINIAHYACGLLHYVGAGLAIAAEAPCFVGSNEEIEFSWKQLTFLECYAVLIFCVASYLQINSVIILSNLRKNKKGIIYTYKHMVPRGGLFEILSSPHITAEIVIYLSLTLILRKNYTWWFVFVWVVVNQSEVALLNHWWYQEEFPNYPRVRKALVPFLL